MGMKKNTKTTKVLELPKELRENLHCMCNSWAESRKAEWELMLLRSTGTAECHHTHDSSYFTGDKMGLM